MPRLTDRIIRDLEIPATGNRVTYDDEIAGFGVRVTAKGAKSFVLNYRFQGLERRMTIGPYGSQQWTLVRARERAGELRRAIASGKDPLAEREDARKAPTVNDLSDRFVEEYLPKKRPATQTDYRGIVDGYIRPDLGRLKVAAVTFTDVDRMHRRITRTAPYRANRAVAVLSKMFSLSIKWEMRKDNPAKGIERNQETKRTRYLSPAELGRLTTALDKYEDQQAANIIRLLLLTGARRGEVQQARWADLDLGEGVWTKPGATTKQKTEHRVPLSGPARQLLAALRSDAGEVAEFVFPGRSGAHRVEMKDAWAEILKAARITNARMHDLRHTYASTLASAGLSLPIIGALLGHTQPATTQRYAHLFDDPLRAATERVGAILSGKPTAEVVKIRRGK